MPGHAHADVVLQPDALVLVEWGEKFPSVVERADGEIVIEHSGVDERMFYVRVKE